MRDIEFNLWLIVFFQALLVGLAVFLLLAGIVLGQMYGWRQAWADSVYTDSRPEVLHGR